MRGYSFMKRTIGAREMQVVNQEQGDERWAQAQKHCTFEDKKTRYMCARPCQRVCGRSHPMACKIVLSHFCLSSAVTGWGLCLVTRAGASPVYPWKYALQDAVSSSCKLARWRSGGRSCNNGNVSVFFLKPDFGGQLTGLGSLPFMNGTSSHGPCPAVLLWD